MSERHLLISFSGGETSAYMTHWIFQNWGDRYDDIVVVFANTGMERVETLDFIRQCDERLGFGTIWIEGRVNPKMGEGTRAEVVTYETASRKGEVFEAQIAKYGIPNTAFKYCSKNMKLQVIDNFARSIGWKARSFDIAIGIRADEIDRMSVEMEARRIVYPLIKGGVRREDVMAFWEDQPFRLQLRSYEGNCRTCWKKSDRKLFTIMSEHPEFFDWDERMEQKYGLVGPEFSKQPPMPDDYRRTFWRMNRSTADMRAQFEQLKAAGKFNPAVDDRIIMQPSFDFELDVGGGCEESCEVFASDDDV